MIRKLSVAFVVALSLAACTSATKRYEQGQKLVLEGKPAEAAERYIQALKKDNRLESARSGLSSAGAAAIDQWLRMAVDPATQAPAAADAYLAIDDLRRRALEVGTSLGTPVGYDESRRAALDKAIARAMSDVPLLINVKQFTTADQHLQRAAASYEPTSVQANAIGSSRGDIAIAWARADTAEGHFRAAFVRVEAMADVRGLNPQQIRDARAIQDASLARGTRRVVVAPPWGTAAARRDLPDDALPALGDALLENPWLTPPRFVTMVPADQTERELRRAGLARRTMTSAEATRLGRALDADYVVITEIDSVRREDTDVRLTRRPARTTRGIDTAYVIEEGRTRLYARATYIVIERDGQRSTQYRTVTSTVASPFMRVRYNGDPRSLDLRQSERDLFERGRAETDLVRAFVSAMSSRLAEGVFDEVVRRIP